MTTKTPDNFAHWVVIENDTQLSRRFDLSLKVVRRMRKQIDIPNISAITMGTDIPSDWAQFALIETNIELQRRYCVGEKVITRWRAESGIRRKRILAPRRQSIGLAFADPVAGAACLFLRTIGYSQVYHRVIHDRSMAGTYMVGDIVMSETELIDHARSRGYTN